MKRLFQVRTGAEIRYFENKMEAKQFRNQHPGTIVQRGPDHKRGK